jgi:hypothetical protein
MVCDVCKQVKIGIVWRADAKGTLAVCKDCAQDLELIHEELKLEQKETS